MWSHLESFEGHMKETYDYYNSDQHNYATPFLSPTQSCQP